MTSSSFSSQSGGGNKDAFRSYPQKFPRAKRKASEMMQHIFQLQKKGPRTMVGQVVDSTFHTTQGYVTATTQLGVVSVYGIPYGTVVPGMRVFVRQMGGAATNRAFVFDGHAPNLSALGSLGSFGYSKPVVTLSSGLAQTSATGVPTSSSVVSSIGYFWYFFFYIPAVPTSTCTIWQMTANTGGNILTCEYLPTGILRVRSQDGHGYVTTSPVAPHNLQWVIMQPGLSPNELLIDMVPNFTGIITPSDKPNFSGNNISYRLSLLSNSDGTALCPLGSWISKFGFGTAIYGSNPVSLQVLGSGLSGTPTADSELPTAKAQTYVTLLYQLLCEDASGSTTLANSAAGAGTAATIASGSAGAVLTTGPY